MPSNALAKSTNATYKGVLASLDVSLMIFCMYSVFFGQFNILFQKHLRSIAHNLLCHCIIEKCKSNIYMTTCVV